MTEAPGVLYLDLEGGWGGSSRSMFYLIENLERRRYRPFAVTRGDGPIGERYDGIGVSHDRLAGIPSFRPAERKNALAYLIYLYGRRGLDRVTARLEEIRRRENIRLLHVNHESLALVGREIARRLGLPWICHIRTQLIPGHFARKVYGMVARDAAHVIFITERNRDHFRDLAGAEYVGERTSTVHNISPPVPDDLAPLPELSEPADATRILSLTNFSPNRGVDRILDVAEILHARGRRDIVFFLCGRLANTRRLPFARNRYLENMMARVGAGGLTQMVRFPGHVTPPDRALISTHCLIKLTRESNPWGRDIIEAMSAGRAVVTLGDFQTFIEDGANGFIDCEFDAERIADHLVRLRDEPGLADRFSRASRQKAADLFDGAARAAEVCAIYDRVVGA
ncbi:MAG: glycosyltransferase family 4 protein [Alphaproteobacteria bacterium]|nr:glycosyltransferase family 4 protein [Alphaproteobacteria bacterium]MDP6589192.1 glycosyltransferase family 4 protein [Alphaproteobacteria bacterium]MDP6816699.1 glycosyltransferase family 4 protein [Alphaproteobacteria bacterium]